MLYTAQKLIRRLCIFLPECCTPLYNFCFRIVNFVEKAIMLIAKICKKKWIGLEVRALTDIRRSSARLRALSLSWRLRLLDDHFSHPPRRGGFVKNEILYEVHDTILSVLSSSEEKYVILKTTVCLCFLMCVEDEKTLHECINLNSTHYPCSHRGFVTDAMRTCLCASNTKDFSLNWVSCTQSSRIMRLCDHCHTTSIRVNKRKQAFAYFSV